MRTATLTVITACLVCGVGGWLMAMPRVEGAPSTLTATIPEGSYVDASGDVVTPSTAGTSTGSTASASLGGASTGTRASSAGRVVVQSTWLTVTSTRTGISQPALTAYADAALETGAVDPGCHLSWNTLAAIGTVESANGTHGGAHLRADGTEVGRILGPVLDGSHGNAAVRDSDGGVLDGDSRWDRAVGPLQILPSTWKEYGVDANGDGVKDPENIDDASLAAARFLCVAGGDLSTATGWSSAIRAYNHDDAYVTAVRQQADAYARDAEQ